MSLSIEYVPPDALKAATYNPRTIDKTALQALAGLLDSHGFVDPVIARRQDGLVLGGHQRLRANALRTKPARLVPVVFLEGIDDQRARALNVALNNPSAQGRFDMEKLSPLLMDLETTGLEVPRLTGFDADEVADLTAALKADALAPVCDLGAARAAGGPGAGGDEDRIDKRDAGDEVVLIFEMTAAQYAEAKKHFEHLVTTHNLTCRVRIGEN